MTRAVFNALDRILAAHFERIIQECRTSGDPRLGSCARFEQLYRTDGAYTATFKLLQTPVPHGSGRLAGPMEAGRLDLTVEWLVAREEELRPLFADFPNMIRTAEYRLRNAAMY